MPAGANPGPRRPASRLLLGAAGEQAAAEWYEAAGYQVVERNWRCRDGEIDLIATRGGTAVFCEVKTRLGNAFGVPAEAVTISKQRRLRRLAALWLSARRSGGGSGFPDLRFDVACVTPGAGGVLAVEVIEAAF